MIPTIGRIVHYKLNEQDAAAINQRRNDSSLHANHATTGDVYPAMIVRAWGATPETAVNLQVLIDGDWSYWATSRHVGDQAGDFAWPERAA